MSVLLRSTPRASLPCTDRKSGGGGSRETQGVDEDKKRKHGDTDEGDVIKRWRKRERDEVAEGRE